MPRRRDDLARQQRLRALDAEARRLLDGNPTLVERTARYLREELDTMTKHSKPETMLTLRVPTEVIDWLTALIPAIEGDAETATVLGGVSRSSVTRLALVEGLRVLERRYKVKLPKRQHP